MRGDLVKSAKFDWGEAYLPYDPEIIKTPLNSIIGGASLWTMTAPDRTPAEYKAVATFLNFIGQPENDAYWHQHTGYVPVTLAGFELSKQQGFYDEEPRRRPAGAATDARHGDQQLERPAAGPAAGDPQHHLRGNGEGLPGQPDRAAGDGQRRRRAATRCCGNSRSR